MKSTPIAQRIRMRDIATALQTGWRTFRGVPAISAAYAGVASLIGLGLLTALGVYGISPMSLAFAGGFLLVAPIQLTGFFLLALNLERGAERRLVLPFGALFGAPKGIWIVSLLCLFLFLVWITDAGVLYSFMVGGDHLPYELPWLARLTGPVLGFWLWSSLMGSVLAFIVFAVSAFSVPLLYEGRAELVPAVVASVQAVLRNFVPCMAWALLLSALVIGAIVLLPLLPVVLPVLAYAGFALYRSVFPPAGCN